MKYQKPEGLTGVLHYNIEAGCVEVNCQKPEGLTVVFGYNIQPELCDFGLLRNCDSSAV